MATQSILLDDLDGSTDDVRSVTFAMNGTTYTLDLGPDSRAALTAALEPFTNAARAERVTRTNGKRERANGNGHSSDIAELRVWARGAGFTVGDRGRIPANVRVAFEAAKAARAV